MSKTFIGEVLEDPEDPEQLLLQFPEDLLQEMGWKEGTVLKYRLEGEDNNKVLIFSVAEESQNT